MTFYGQPCQSPGWPTLMSHSLECVWLCSKGKTSPNMLFSWSQGKGTWKTYWLLSAVKRPSCKVNKHLHPNGQPFMNYLSTPGHHFGSSSSLNLKRTDSLRRSMKGNSPTPIKKSWHKTDEESAALLNQTTVWLVRVFTSLVRDFFCMLNYRLDIDRGEEILGL